MKQDKEIDAGSMERSNAGTKNEVAMAKTMVQAYLPPGSLRPETVDEFPD